jgi:hypothetical protein
MRILKAMGITRWEQSLIQTAIEYENIIAKIQRVGGYTPEQMEVVKHHNTSIEGAEWFCDKLMAGSDPETLLNHIQAEGQRW